MRTLSSMLILASAAMAANSVMALRQGGLLETSGHAAFKGTADAGHALPEICSYDALNVSSLAFCDRVGFGASLSLEEFKTDGASNIAASQLSLRSFNAFFPTRYFSLGLGYEQISPRSVKVSSDDREWNLYGGRSNMSLAVAIPFSTTGLALGTRAGLLTGSTREDLTIEQVKATPVQKWTRHSVDDYDGQQYALSLEFKQKQWAVFASAEYTSDWTAGRTTTLNQTINDSTLTTEYTAGTTSFPEVNTVSLKDELPASMTYALGFGFQVNELNALALDLDFGDQVRRTPNLLDPNGLDPAISRMEDEMPWRVSAGYTFGNSNKLYDSFYKKMALRTGLSLRSLGFEDAKEYKGSLGFGLPLGSRGSRMDVAVEGGLRNSSQYDNEQFVSLWVSLHGFGKWGQPSRRYR